MKKYLLILLATMAFVACDDMFSSDEVDFSTMTIEELLTTGGGIDYLVSQAKEINYDELNERLKTEVLYAQSQNIYYKVDGKWNSGVLDGMESTYFVLMEDNKFRHCYEPTFDLHLGKGYKTYDVHDNAAAEMIDKAHSCAKILAYVGNTLVCEYESYGIPTRFLASIGHWRESVLNEYARDFEDPATWMDEYLERFE